MRPDRSHIMLVPAIGAGLGYQKGGLKAVLLGDERSALANDEFLNLLAKSVLGNVPFYLTCGTENAKEALVNELARPAIAKRDKQELVNLLFELFDKLARAVTAEKGPLAP